MVSNAQMDETPISVISDDTGIVFLLPRPLAKGEKATLTFHLSGTPARGVTRIPTGIYTGYFGCD